MRDRKSCLAEARRPNLTRGERVTDGRFVRNLKHNEAPKRFERDGEPPEFGYRVKTNDWQWDAEDETDGLSVNLRECACTLLCALLLHPQPDMFQHVVVIDIDALSQELELAVVATYDPDPDEVQNPCHFNLVPRTVSVEQLLVTLRAWERSVFEPNRKIPKDIERALTERAWYERVFKVHRDVRESPGARG